MWFKFKGDRWVHHQRRLNARQNITSYSEIYQESFQEWESQVFFFFFWDQNSLERQRKKSKSSVNDFWPLKADRKATPTKRTRPLSFQAGEHVFLKIKPRRGIIRFGKKGKLSPRYIEPFEILEKVGEVAYRLALPPQIDRVHNVFHVSMLRKYMSHPSHILNWEEVTLNDDTTFDELPVEIQDYSEKKTRGRTIQLVRILWRHRGIEESTWKRADTMRTNYPYLFPSEGIL